MVVLPTGQVQVDIYLYNKGIGFLYVLKFFASLCLMLQLC